MRSKKNFISVVYAWDTGLLMALKGALNPGKADIYKVHIREYGSTL